MAEYSILGVLGKKKDDVLISQNFGKLFPIWYTENL